MKSTAIVCAIAAATLSLSSLSFAQGNDRRGDDRDGRNWNHQDARNDRDHDRRLELRRGGYVPQDMRSRQYVVNDWRGHNLSAPPRGQQWVQVGSDYALVAIATGLIANLVLNSNGPQYYYNGGYAKDARGAKPEGGM